MLNLVCDELEVRPSDVSLCSVCYEPVWTRRNGEKYIKHVRLNLLGENFNFKCLDLCIVEAYSLEMEDIVDWKSTTWSHLIAITAGLKPFTDPAIGIIPEVFRAFLPSIDYTPSAVDRKNAASILKKALHLVNVATVEYSKVAYRRSSSLRVRTILHVATLLAVTDDPEIVLLVRA